MSIQIVYILLWDTLYTSYHTTRSLDSLYGKSDTGKYFSGISTCFACSVMSPTAPLEVHASAVDLPLWIFDQ
jgi:hypothetical protein